MADDPGGRRRIDLSVLPGGVRLLIAVATAVLIGGIALLVGRPTSGPLVPVSAIVAAVIAFAFVAWRAQHRR